MDKNEVNLLLWIYGLGENEKVRDLINLLHASKKMNNLRAYRILGDWKEDGIYVYPDGIGNGRLTSYGRELAQEEIKKRRRR